MFADADPRALKDSYGTLHMCRYLGGDGTQIIDTKWITDVVGMVPFKYVRRETNYTEGEQYFVVEKMTAAMIGRTWSESSDDGDDGVGEDNSEE